MKKLLFLLFFCWAIASCNTKPGIMPDGQLGVFPNPAMDYTSIYISGNESFKLEVFNAEGKKILEQTGQHGGKNFQIQLQGEPKGNCQAILQTPSGVYRQKFLKL